ncbi:hypothetical protein IAR55_004334 [Kwoniella newhampshirensis]|uniref:TIGR02453 family protein n=1 Tax=Kwoniella newhampshirensis TaxID=1651941 RepID=A0AAW0YJZ3_9TREE
MVQSKTTPRRSARASPRVSSTRSTPRAKTSTTLKQSTTPTSTRSGRSVKPTTSSPYFPKAQTKPNTGQRQAKSRKEARGTAGARSRQVNDESDDEFDSATGLTESEPPSSTDDSDSEDAFDPSSDEGFEEYDEEVVQADGSDVDSDFLDEEENEKKGKKRKSVGGGGGGTKKVKEENGPGKVKRDSGKGGHGIEGYENEDDDSEIELEDGQEIAGRIYPAPKTGQVPPGRISKNTFNYQRNLQIPERNDRDWFRSHEPAFRQAEKEWQAFVGLIQSKLHEVDDEIPHLPPRDIIHRFYRDVRFSSDKTPYKRNFSMSTSRGGRKGVFACYHISICPNGKSIMAGGLWQPGKDELASIRSHLLADPQRFRDVIENEEFVKVFGEAKEKKGKRQNVFGHDDALKVAPKGVEKGHKDIDLLKLRSVAVLHHFTDEEVLHEKFQDAVKEVARVLVPFVRMLNDFLARTPDGGNGNDTDEAGDEADQGED